MDGEARDGRGQKHDVVRPKDAERKKNILVGIEKKNTCGGMRCESLTQLDAAVGAAIGWTRIGANMPVAGRNPSAKPVNNARRTALRRM